MCKASIIFQILEEFPLSHAQMKSSYRTTGHRKKKFSERALFRVLETIRINYVVLCGSDDMNFNDIEKKKISLFLREIVLV